MLNHVLLEIFCLKETYDNHSKPLPPFCPAADTPGYHCLYHRCPFLDFTSCENTLCYINENAEMEEGILFGGEMESAGHEPEELELWKHISVDAVNRAYETYMQQRGTQWNTN